MSWVSVVSTALGRPVDPDVSFSSAAPRYAGRATASRRITPSSSSRASPVRHASGDNRRRQDDRRRTEPIGELEDLVERRADVDRQHRRSEAPAREHERDRPATIACSAQDQVARLEAKRGQARSDTGGLRRRAAMRSGWSLSRADEGAAARDRRDRRWRIGR